MLGQDEREEEIEKHKIQFKWHFVVVFLSLLPFSSFPLWFAFLFCISIFNNENEDENENRNPK